MAVRSPLLMLLVFISTACAALSEQADDSALDEFARRYAAAWSSQDPEALAAYYAENGSLVVNDGDPSVGRAAIAAKAAAFMGAFPDMLVKLDSLVRREDHAVFHWTWTGTNNGPGGTGRSVRISGYEVWTMDAAGLIVESKGHYDEAEYRRQVGDGNGME
jgi:steroid delta-isomerase-like uncharacterized protein